MTIRQPWASAILDGRKTWETRTGRTTHRGAIAIHAGLGGPCDDARLPYGAIIGTATIVECVRVETIRDALSTEERALGDYSDGRWAWRLSDVRPLSEALPARGALGLWEWPAKPR